MEPIEFVFKMQGKEELLRLVAALQDLLYKRVPIPREGGICFYIETVMQEIHAWNYGHYEKMEMLNYLQQVFLAWPKFSGHCDFPVGGSGHYSAITHFQNNARNPRVLWSRRTKYGRQRWELLAWITDNLNLTIAWNVQQKTKGF